MLDACAKPTLNGLTIVPACWMTQIDAVLIGQRRHAAVNNEGSKGEKSGERVDHAVKDRTLRDEKCAVRLVVGRQRTDRESYHP